MSSKKRPKRQPLTYEEVGRIVDAVRPVRAALDRSIDSDSYLELTFRLTDVLNTTPAGPWYRWPDPYLLLPSQLQQPMRDVARLIATGDVSAPNTGDPIKRKLVAAVLDDLLTAWDNVRQEQLRVRSQPEKPDSATLTGDESVKPTGAGGGEKLPEWLRLDDLPPDDTPGLRGNLSTRSSLDEVEQEQGTVRSSEYQGPMEHHAGGTTRVGFASSAG